MTNSLEWETKLVYSAIVCFHYLKPRCRKYDFKRYSVSSDTRKKALDELLAWLEEFCNGMKDYRIQSLGTLPTIETNYGNGLVMKKVPLFVEQADGYEAYLDYPEV